MSMWETISFHVFKKSERLLQHSHANLHENRVFRIHAADLFSPCMFPVAPARPAPSPTGCPAPSRTCWPRPLPGPLPPGAPATPARRCGSWGSSPGGLWRQGFHRRSSPSRKWPGMKKIQCPKYLCRKAQMFLHNFLVKNIFLKMPHTWTPIGSWLMAMSSVLVII